jgi:REP element-mobilizing transposase RayT
MLFLNFGQTEKRMEKKEFYRHNLPHFQQPGQAYFVTWNLKNAIPRKAYSGYTQKLEELKNKIKLQAQQHAPDDIINELRANYQYALKKYFTYYNKILDRANGSEINLVKTDILDIIEEALCFWEKKKIESYAYCVMPNHIHWVFGTFPADEKGNAVYLQDILHSVKRYSANKINQRLGRSGALWQKESFDTTIRDKDHLYKAIAYTLNNPVKAGFVKKWMDWKGCWYDGWGDF